MITASLVSGAEPQLVQLVVDGVPDGLAWRIVGRVGQVLPGLVPGPGVVPSSSTLPEAQTLLFAGYSWDVPGGFGVGDGDQVVLTDNRAPGNTTVVYSLVTESGEEASDEVTVTFPGDADVVLQSGDGQRRVAGWLLQGSTEDIELPTNVASFRVAGRARPVTRYDVLGDVVSTLRVLLPLAEKTPFRNLLRPGEPLVYRFGEDVADLDRVAVIQVTRVASSRVWSDAGLREWILEYEIIDDPWADIRLGAFSWGDLNAAFGGRSWADFDAVFTGATWADFDRADWAVI